MNVDPAGRRSDGEYQFVLDASGEPKQAESQSLWNSLLSALAGAKTEESPEYDLLYFDANHDLDLTNDPVVKPMKEPPKALLSSTIRGVQKSTVFEHVSVPIDYGTGIGVKPFQLVPVLLAGGAGPTYLRFATTVLRQGIVRLGKKAYNAVLSQGVITGRFDRPKVRLSLKSQDREEKPQSPWDELLGTMRRDQWTALRHLGFAHRTSHSSVRITATSARWQSLPEAGT